MRVAHRRDRVGSLQPPCTRGRQVSPAVALDDPGHVGGGALDARLRCLPRRRACLCVQGLSAALASRVRQEVATGSWLGLPYQRQGLGKEMRAAVLVLAFTRLGALSAVTGAFTDNPAAVKVSRALGYRDDGQQAADRNGVRCSPTGSGSPRPRTCGTGRRLPSAASMGIPWHVRSH